MCSTYLYDIFFTIKVKNQTLPSKFDTPASMLIHAFDFCYTTEAKHAQM